ncbi:MAG: MBL fold metallo-hydrolase [Lachnospiraceae bacterium]|nr:MBL fold metallo-hydrolase [Lachnospiraceae bacterium]
MPEIKITDRISYIPSCERPISGDVGIVRGDKFTYIYDTGSTRETLDFLYSLNGRCDIVISHFHGDHTWWLTKHKPGDEGVETTDSISLTYERPEFRRIYVGSLTKKYISDGMTVTAPTLISSGSGLRLAADVRIIPSEERLASIEEKQVLSEKGQISLEERLASSEEKQTSSKESPVPEEKTAGAGQYDGVKVDVIPIPNSHCKGALMMMVDDEYAFIGDSSYCMTKDGKGCYNAQLLKEEIDLLERIPADKILVSHDRKFIRDKAVVLRQLKAIYGRRTSDSPYIFVK